MQKSPKSQLYSTEWAGKDLGLERLGGSGAEDAAIGQIMGPGFGAHEIADAVERVVNLYLKERGPGERFLDTYRRVGMEPFKNVAYQEQMNAAYNG